MFEGISRTKRTSFWVWIELIIPCFAAIVVFLPIYLLLSVFVTSSTPFARKNVFKVDFENKTYRFLSPNENQNDPFWGTVNFNPEICKISFKKNPQRRSREKMFPHMQRHTYSHTYIQKDIPMTISQKYWSILT